MRFNRYDRRQKEPDLFKKSKVEFPSAEATAKISVQLACCRNDYMLRPAARRSVNKAVKAVAAMIARISKRTHVPTKSSAAEFLLNNECSMKFTGKFLCLKRKVGDYRRWESLTHRSN